MTAGITGGDALADGRTIGGLAPAELAGRFGTPLYVYDLDAITRRAAALCVALPAAVDLAFAVKANPSLAVVAALGAAGLGADVASEGELALALRAGIPADRIVVTGPAKRDSEIMAAVQAGVRAVTVESPGELARLERIAREAGRRQPVLLRRAVPAMDGAGIAIGGARGRGAQFGMGAADLRAAYRSAERSPAVEPLGVHAFGASNVRDATALARHVERTIAFARRAAAVAGVPPRLVDAGGGLGIPYADAEVPLDLAALGRALDRLLEHDARSHPAAPPLRLLLEPGRFLVGPAGLYIASVIDVKAGRGETIATLDGGIHHLLRPALVGASHRTVILPRAASAVRRGRVLVAGPLCTGLDVLATLDDAPIPAPGDLVVVRDTGAYGFTESMPFFLSHPTPAEVVVRGGRAALARPRLDPAAWAGEQSSCFDGL